MRLFIVIVLVVFVGVVAAIFAFGPGIGGSMDGLKGIGGGFSSAPTGTLVRAQEVPRDRLIETVSAPGTVEPRTKVDISAEVSARIEELPFREGDRVQKGEVVVRLDDRDLSAALESATARRDAEHFRLQSDQARLAGPTSSVEYARKQLDRQQKLFETGDVSREALEDAQERLDDLEATLEALRMNISVMENSVAAANADIQRAEEALSKTVIRAPIDGLVTTLNAEVGELVVVGTMNNAGTVILTIADLSSMLLKAEVAEADVARVEPNQTARIFVNAYPDVVFSGIVERVDLQRTNVPGQAGYFETEVRINLDGRQILSGLAANVDVEIAEHEGLVVPSQAILQRTVDDLPDEVRRHPLLDTTRKVAPVVFRVVEGSAICTPVRVGPSDLAKTLVLQGLEDGDVVVSGPFKALERLKPGDAVRVEQSEEAPAEDDDTEELAGEDGATVDEPAGAAAG